MLRCTLTRWGSQARRPARSSSLSHISSQTNGTTTDFQISAIEQVTGDYQMEEPARDDQEAYFTNFAELLETVEMASEYHRAVETACTNRTSLASEASTQNSSGPAITPPQTPSKNSRICKPATSASSQEMYTCSAFPESPHVRRQGIQIPGTQYAWKNTQMQEQMCVDPQTVFGDFALENKGKEIRENIFSFQPAEPSINFLMNNLDSWLTGSEAPSESPQHLGTKRAAKYSSSCKGVPSVPERPDLSFSVNFRVGKQKQATKTRVEARVEEKVKGRFEGKAEERPENSGLESCLFHVSECRVARPIRDTDLAPGIERRNYSFTETSTEETLAQNPFLPRYQTTLTGATEDACRYCEGPEGELLFFKRNQNNYNHHMRLFHGILATGHYIPQPKSAVVEKNKLMIECSCGARITGKLKSAKEAYTSYFRHYKADPKNPNQCIKGPSV